MRRSVPPLLWAPGLLGLAFLVLPLVALVLRAPWATLPGRLVEPGVLTALRLSVTTASAATVLAVLVGVPLAVLLARVEFPGRRLVRALVTLPLVLPPVVGGVALSGDGQLVASGGGDGTVKLWETSSGRLLATLQSHTGAIPGVAQTGPS